MSGPSPATLAMIERFIGFETTSRVSNLPLIQFARDYLAGLGAETVVTYDDERGKGNLFATIGPRDRQGIVLSGHTDTVPVDGQRWASDPFRLRAANGKLFGRGVVDMKGFLAIAVAQAPEFLARGLQTPIHYALSYDEEVGCRGVPRLIADLRRRGIAPRACIVGEPSMMQVVRSHKGKIGCHVEVTGVAAHTGVPHIGVNAIEAAAETIACLKRIARRLRDEGPFAPEFEAPAYTTIQHGLIHGGVAVNTVPSHCEFDFDIRFLPGVDPLAIVREAQDFVTVRVLPEMQAVSSKAGFRWEIVPGAEALDTDADDPVVALAKRHARTDTVRRVGFGTEAGYFQKAGIATVICGPGNVEQAHKADEFLDLDQVARCEAFLCSLMDEICAQQ
jgi:acetylornithine deacetylase